MTKIDYEQGSQQLISVLMIDEGLGFGGSFIVSARLAEYLENSEFSPIIATAAPIDEVKHRVASNTKLISLKKRLNYRHRFIFNQQANALKFGLLIKLATYCYSMFESLLNFSNTLKIISIILKYDVKIVHSNNSFNSILAAKILKRKIIWHVHGEGKVRRRSQKKMLPKCDYILFISEFSKNNALASLDRIPPYSVIWNPIGTPPILNKAGNKELLIRTHRIDASNKIVGIFGRFVDWKGQLELLWAIKLLQEKGISVCVLLVGDDGEKFGRYGEQLRDYCAKNLAPNSFVFTGFVTDPNPYYQACDIVVHASTSPEPFGLVITEAMQNKTVIIGSIYGAATELIADKETGLLSDPKDPVKLADAIEFLISNRQERERYAEKAYEFAIEKMHPANYANSISEIYRNLLT